MHKAYDSAGPCNELRLRLALSKGPNTMSPFPQLKTERGTVSETLFFLVIRIPGEGQSPQIKGV
jgi:hypothetical protein